jgi:hypothetical protein
MGKNLSHLKPRVVPRWVKLLLQEGVKVPKDLHGRVAICVGLLKPVRGCEWSVLGILKEGGKAARELLASIDSSRQLLGVAVVPMSRPPADRQEVQLVSQGGKVLRKI